MSQQGLLIQGSAALLMEDTLKAEYGLLYKRHLLHERRPGRSCFSALGVCSSSGKRKISCAHHESLEW